MSAHPTPPDQTARQRIRDDLDSTLFIEAGAGAGKTSSLVDRVVNLVESGVSITSIAAITFTEKAAAELRHRLRAKLSQKFGEERAGWARAALDELDHAPIGTLHAFARRILFDHPIEAELPPGFTVLDELESNIVFEEEWDDLLDRLLAEADPVGGILEGGRTFVELLEFDNFGVSTAFRKVAEDFRWNWDLVATNVELSAPPPLDLHLAPVIHAAQQIGHTPVPDGDAQHALAARAAQLGNDLHTSTNLRTTLVLLDELATDFAKAGRKGNKQKWKALGPDGIDALDAIRDAEVAVAELASTLVEQAKSHRKRVVGAIAGQFVLDSARERARTGRLEFHDLLVFARRLLATNATCRSSLHDRYQRVLLDEFQDTDPIQLEIAVRLSSRPDDPAQGQDWRDLVPEPGRLFIVGDPKQSIYRFRRADIAQYLRAADQVGADTETLSANFRSTSAVIDFTNDVFSRLIEHVPDSQPAFQSLDACRHPALLSHGSVTVLGDARHDDLAKGSWAGDGGAADELRRREATDIAATVSNALATGWPVVDPTTGPTDAGATPTRPCRPGDICILLPTRISLPSLESALRANQIPYRAENSAVVYATSEIRHLLLALRAADDPTDELAVVASLRTTLYGCSDVDLWQWRRSGGTWGIWRPPPENLDASIAGGPVADGLAHLRSISERIGTTSPADLLAAIADERRMYDLALDGPDSRDVWRRLRYVIDQARAWSDAGGHGVRRYLQWARMQAHEGRGADTILPEQDHDAVRVMTVHAAKGLEFPITIVGGLTTQPARRRGVGVVWEADTWHLTGRGDDGSFADHQPLDELMSDGERRRLLYVACTRAVDHLVVSLHRAMPTKANADYEQWDKLTSAELMWVGGSAAPTSGATPAAFDAVAVSTQPATRHSALDVADHDVWQAERAAVLQRAGRRDAIAATRLADEVAARRDSELVDDPGLDKHPVNIDLPPWQRGRYGTSIGRAVHGVLQFCNLETGDDIDNLASSQCAAEGVIGLDDRVAALARSAITAPIVQTVVAGAEHWRELFVAAPIGDRVLEGYVDLLIRTPDGLVIVDYKTDQWSGPVQSGERIGRYRTQLAAYGAALESALGEPVVGGILVRCRPGDTAEEIVINDWQAAVAEVTRLVS